MAQSTPRREDCKECILRVLDEAGGSMKSKDLEDAVKAKGYSYMTLRRAKDELKNDDVIKYHNAGFGKEKEWHVVRNKPLEAARIPQVLPLPRQEHENGQISL